MSLPIPSVDERKTIARRIFDAALAAVNPSAAVDAAVTVSGETISIGGTVVSTAAEPRRVVAVAIGKAAFTMAAGLDQALGPLLQAGIAVGLASDGNHAERRLAKCWSIRSGGHPLPTEGSFRAGRAVVDFVQGYDGPNSALVFLISGGGSALVELPIDPSITLYDLAAVNSLLLANSVPISEVNIVRRGLSAIKGGGLARFAPCAQKIGLIVADTNPGDETSVASGPTFPSPRPHLRAVDVLDHYGLWARVPPILRASLSAPRTLLESNTMGAPVRNHVLLDSDDAVAGAANAARELGLHVILPGDIREQEISEGCRELADRLRSSDRSQPVCLISAGEFRTPVTGNGRGGRNAETALRLAVMLGENARDPKVFTAILGATDGIDGNCPAAGAVIDETTIPRSDTLGLDPHDFLARSDSYSFFAALGDAIVTGPTGTNVRDLRIVIGWP